jgi:hypothetical protein
VSAQLQLDMNLSRAFTFKPNDKEHQHVHTIHARSINLLNHTNVTTVETVPSSGAVGRPVAAETAPRVELGARFAL